MFSSFYSWIPILDLSFLSLVLNEFSSSNSIFFFQMGKACMFMILLTDLAKLFFFFLAETQDNAFVWVRLWVSTMKWKKCPTFNKSWGVVSCQTACPFFAKLCFGWFMVQHLSQTEFPGMVYQDKQQKLKESSVMIFLTKVSWYQPSCCYHPSQFQVLVSRKLWTLWE